MKIYSVTIIAYATVIVQAESDDAALMDATELVDYGDFHHDETRPAKEVPDADINSELRNSDATSWELSKARARAMADPFAPSAELMDLIR